MKNLKSFAIIGNRMATLETKVILSTINLIVQRQDFILCRLKAQFILSIERYYYIKQIEELPKIFKGKDDKDGIIFNMFYTWPTDEGMSHKVQIIREYFRKFYT